MTFYLLNGLLSGLILAAFLALCDGLFQTKTFQVLIDVNYIPPLSRLPAIVEFALHLLVSVLVTAVVLFFYPRISGMPLLKYLLIWLGVFCLLYFPLSLLLNLALSFQAFVIWTVGHVLYLAFLVFQMEKQR